MWKIISIMEKDKVIKSVFLSYCGKYFGYVVENVEHEKYKDIVKIYELKELKKLYEEKYNTLVDDIAISENLNRILMVTRSNVILMDRDFRKLFLKLDVKNVLHFAYVSKDSKKFAIATYNPGTVRFYEDNVEKFSKRTRNRITGFFMDSNANFLIAVDEDSTLYVFNENGDLILLRNIEKSGIYKVTMINNKIVLTISGEEFSINMYNLDGSLFKKVELKKEPLCVHATKKYIFVGAEDSLLCFDKDLRIISETNFESYINDVHSELGSDVVLVGTDSGLYILKRSSYS